MKRLGTAVAVAAALALAGCDTFRVLESSREDFVFEELGPEPARVTVRLDRGRIDVLGSSADRVEVEVRKQARGIDREAARSLLDAVEVEVRETPDGVRVESRSSLGAASLVGGWVGIEIRLQVPERIDLDVRTGDGSVEVRDVAGEITVDTGDGRVELYDLSGNVRVRTSDGRIEGRGLEGSLDARTEDGRIQVEGRFERLDATTGDGSIRVDASAGRGSEGESDLERGWTLRSADGSVRLVLPSTLSANLDASTLDGSIDLDLSSFTGTVEERRVTGSIGRGGATILVHTMDGGIRLEER